MNRLPARRHTSISYTEALSGTGVVGLLKDLSRLLDSQLFESFWFTAA